MSLTFIYGTKQNRWIPYYLAKHNFPSFYTTSHPRPHDSFVSFHQCPACAARGITMTPVDPRSTLSTDPAEDEKFIFTCKNCGRVLGTISGPNFNKMNPNPSVFTKEEIKLYQDHLHSLEIEAAMERVDDATAAELYAPYSSSYSAEYCPDYY